MTYSDDVAIDVSTLDDDDLVVNPGALAATFVSVDTPGDGTPRVATYTITPPGGAWAETAIASKPKAIAAITSDLNKVVVIRVSVSILLPLLQPRLILCGKSTKGGGGCEVKYDERYDKR